MATTTKSGTRTATVTPITKGKAKAAEPEPEIEEYHGPSMISTPKLIGAFLVMCLVLWFVYSAIGAPHVDGNGVAGALIGFVIVAGICYVAGLVAEHLLHLHHRSILAGLGHLTAGMLKLAGTNGEKFLNWSYVQLGKLLGPNWTRFCGAVSTLFRGKEHEGQAGENPLEPDDPEYIGTAAGMERLRRAIYRAWCDRPADLERLVRTATGQFIAYLCDEVMQMVGAITDEAEKALSMAYGAQVWIDSFTSPNGVVLRVVDLPEDKPAQAPPTDPADAPAPAETSAGETPAEPRKDLPVSTTTTDMEPRRSGGRLGGRVPPAGRAMIAWIDDFTPIDDDELHEHVLGTAAFLHDLGVAMQDLHSRCVASDVRLGKGAMQATHDAADGVVDAGGVVTKASASFADYYGTVSEEVASGKELPKDGDFITGNN